MTDRSPTASGSKPIRTPQFGTAAPGVDYIERPGAYALALRDGLVLVVETPSGSFLPGGGVDGNELPVVALARELREEAGLRATELVEMGTAGQYVIEATTCIGYNKIETFFLVTGLIEDSMPSEDDHRPRWVTIEDALANLREPAQAWALWRALEQAAKP